MSTGAYSGLSLEASASLDEAEAEREHRLPGIIGVFVRSSSVAASDFAELLGDGDGHIGRPDADLTWRLQQLRVPQLEQLEQRVALLVASDPNGR